MAVISTVFSRRWDIMFPMVTRYMEKKYVDDFFEEGKLRLSSFKRFRNNSDEQQGDPFEGRISMQIEVPNGNHVFLGANGQEAYVLSSGTVENANMVASFNTEDGFRIINTLAFADSISRHIPGFVAGMEGLCIYRESLSIQERDDLPITPPNKLEDHEEWDRKYNLYMAEKTRKAFFLKHLKYSNQGEYRFIWFTTGESEKEYLDIVCPEAVKYCQRLP